MLDEVRYNIKSYMSDFGLDISEYVDKDALAQGLVDEDGWGMMNGYNGNYDNVYINDDSYNIMRIN
jgi:hypothetical protein